MDGPEETRTLHSRYQFGDQVRHPKKPEWGTGSIVKIENLTMNGGVDQRLTVRFPNSGLKVLLASASDLQVIDLNGKAAAGGSLLDDHTLRAKESENESGWLGTLAKQKPVDVMTALPPQVSDPFSSIKRRLEFTVALYRFDTSPSRLIEWAVAQSGLNDPMTRFNRHELEQFFTKFAYERDLQLLRLCQEANRAEPETVRQIFAKAPSTAQQVMKKGDALR
jgi:hypothetical protein